MQFLLSANPATPLAANFALTHVTAGLPRRSKTRELLTSQSRHSITRTFGPLSPPCYRPTPPDRLIFLPPLPSSAAFFRVVQSSLCRRLTINQLCPSPLSPRSPFDRFPQAPFLHVSKSARARRPRSQPVQRKNFPGRQPKAGLLAAAALQIFPPPRSSANAPAARQLAVIAAPDCGPLPRAIAGNGPRVVNQRRLSWRIHSVP